MSVRREQRINPKTGRTREFWMIDVDFEHPSGKSIRVRKVSPVQTKRGAEQYERELRQQLLAGNYRKKEVPTLEEFEKTFMEDYAKANRLKHSGIVAKESILKHHLVPDLPEAP